MIIVTIGLEMSLMIEMKNDTGQDQVCDLPEFMLLSIGDDVYLDSSDLEILNSSLTNWFRQLSSLNCCRKSSFSENYFSQNANFLIPKKF